MIINFSTLKSGGVSMKKFGLFERSEKNPDALNIWSILLPVMFYLVCGVLLIVLRDQAVTIAAYAFAALMLICGVWQVIVYLRSVPIRRITEARLAIGLILVLGGALLAFSPDILHDLLPVAWGLSLLFGAFLKIQYAFDEMALKIRRWWILLIFAAFSLATGILALLRPDFLGENEKLVIGIMLIVEAILDMTVYFLLSHAMKHQPSGTVTLTPSAAPVPAAESAKETEVSSSPDSESVPDPEPAPIPPLEPIPDADSKPIQHILPRDPAPKSTDTPVD